MLLWVLECMRFLNPCVWVFWIYTEEWDCWIISQFSEKASHCFHSGCPSSHPHQCRRFLSTPSPALVTCALTVASLTGVRWFWSAFLWWLVMSSIFSCAFAHLHFLFRKVSSSSTHSLMGPCVCLTYELFIYVGQVCAQLLSWVQLCEPLRL